MIFKQICQQKFSENLQLTKPLPRGEQEEFLANVNIEVPEEQKQTYKELLAKHYDEFSTNKNDLGWANHFEHKMTTKDENPTYRKRFSIPETRREGLKK
jgi:hypothetical protein